MYEENDYNYYRGYRLDDFRYSFDLKESEINILDEAIFLVDNKVSIRDLSKEFCRSKTSIHRDLTSQLRDISYELYSCVQRQLKDNKKKYFR